MSNYIWYPASAGNYSSIPNAASLNIAGDMEVLYRLSRPAWTGVTHYLSGMWGGAGTRSWYISIVSSGGVYVSWTEDGTNNVGGSVSGSTITVAAGTPTWLKGVFDTDGGASGEGRWTFYESDSDTNDPDEVTWTQLGSPKDGGSSPSSIFTGSLAMGVNAYVGTGGGAGAAVCSFYRYIIKDGIDGTTVLDIDYGDLSSAELSAGEFAESSSNAATVTLNGTGWAYVRPTTNTLLQRAELLLEAGDGNEGGSALWADRSGNDHHATPTNSPTFLAHDGVQYVWFPGTANNTVSTPDNAAFDVTDLDVRIKLVLEDTTPSATIAPIGRDASAPNRNFWIDILTGGSVRLIWSTNGTSLASAASTATIGSAVSADDLFWLRATLDVDNGASGYDVKFYTSSDGSTWTQLGNTVTGGATTSIAATNTALYVGSRDGSSDPFPGKVHVAEVYNGIDGTLVARMDASEASEPFASWTGADDGLTWTVNRAASGYVSTVVDRDMWVLDGSDDHFVVADDNDLDFDTTDSLTMVIAVRYALTSASSYLAGKHSSLNLGYSFLDGSNTVAFRFGDGTNVPSDTAAHSDSDLRILKTFGGRRDVVNDNVEAFVSGVASGSPSTDSTTATAANNNALILGRKPYAAEAFFGGAIIAFAIFREALTDAEVGLVSTLLVSPDAPDPSTLHGDALWDWIQQYEGRISGNDTELVGELNALNGTSDKEYAEARGAYLSVDPAG